MKGRWVHVEKLMRVAGNTIYHLGEAYLAVSTIESMRRFLDLTEEDVELLRKTRKEIETLRRDIARLCARIITKEVDE